MDGGLNYQQEKGAWIPTDASRSRMKIPLNLRASANLRAREVALEIEVRRDKHPMFSDIWHMYESSRLLAILALYQAEDH